MSDLKLGVLIDDKQARDAAHVAVAPVVAAERLVPGAKIGFVSKMDTERVGVRTQHVIGVVDPFLTEMVEIGQRFWMLVNPHAVTSIRHDWQHPAFTSSASEQWLRHFATLLKMPYEELMRDASRVLTGGDPIYRHNRHGDDETEYIENEHSFWKHYEIVTGAKVHDHDINIVEFCC